MKSTLISKSSLFSANNIRLKKKNIHLKKITKYISKLKTSLNEKSNSKKLNFLSQKNSLKKKKRLCRFILDLFFVFICEYLLICY